MKRQAFESFDITSLPLVGMFLFLGLFIAIVIWVFLKSNQKPYENAANLPLEEGHHG